MKTILLIALLILLTPLAIAATDVGIIREQAIIESIQLENQKTRENITAFGEDTHQMYIQEKNNALREINNVVTKVKFTFAITTFCAVLAALELHNFFKRRREKKYNTPTTQKAEQLQTQLEKPPPPPPPPPPPSHNPERWDA